jgi:hypothetical protein
MRDKVTISCATSAETFRDFHVIMQRASANRQQCDKAWYSYKINIFFPICAILADGLTRVELNRSTLWIDESSPRLGQSVSALMLNLQLRQRLPNENNMLTSDKTQARYRMTCHRPTGNQLGNFVWQSHFAKTRFAASPARSCQMSEKR